MFLNHPKMFWAMRRLDIWFFSSPLVAFVCAFGVPIMLMQGVVWLMG